MEDLYVDRSSNLIVYRTQTADPRSWAAQESKFIKLQFWPNWLIEKVVQNDFDMDKLEEIYGLIVRIGRNKQENKNNNNIRKGRIGQTIKSETVKNKELKENSQNLSEIIKKLKQENDSLSKVLKTKALKTK